MPSSLMVPAGYTLTGLFTAFMLIASVAPKLIGASVAIDSMVELGWPPGHTLTIGLIELGCLALFLFPRTTLIGAVLMTGLLGGAMATQIRVGNPLFSHALFSVYLGLFMWGGLWLRSPWLRDVFPFVAPSR